MIHLKTVIEKIHRENKYCVILGDFNLDLFKFESHPGTNDLLNTLVSSYFQPQILQPTRITDHSATLIDNIFFNSLEHFTISGNLIYDLTDHLPNFLVVSKFSCLLDNGQLISNPSAVLNHFFASPRIQEAASNLTEEDFSDHPSIAAIKNNSYLLEFTFMEIKTDVITDNLLELNAKKATRHDGLSPKILKLSAAAVSNFAHCFG